MSWFWLHAVELGSDDQSLLENCELMWPKWQADESDTARCALYWHATCAAVEKSQRVARLMVRAVNQNAVVAWLARHVVRHQHFATVKQSRKCERILAPERIAKVDAVS